MKDRNPEDAGPEIGGFTIAIGGRGRGGFTISGRPLTQEEIRDERRLSRRLRRWWFNSVVLPLRQWRYGIRVVAPRGLGVLLQAVTPARLSQLVDRRRRS